MKYLIFYLGACLMGLASLVSMLAIYSSNKRVLRDLKNPRETKDKWLSGFIQEYQKLLKDKIEIHNPSVYVTKRMRGRKIALWNIRQIKGISWGNFLLSFFFVGVEIVLLRQGENIMEPVLFPGSEMPLMSLTVFTGIGMGIVLLLVRLLAGTGYQEEELETNLLDYVENCQKEPAKIISIEEGKAAGSREIRDNKRKERQSSEKKEKAARQMEQGILEAAATDSRYSHLLNKEEEEIVKDVVKEFLT